MKHLFIILFSSFFTLVAYGQSLSGNMNTVLEGEKVVMKYGNVDIYKEDKLVKTVLTDEYGNFNVKLDTGTYVCVLNYDGYAPVRKEIRVKGDVKEDFVVAESAIGGAKMKKDRAKSMEYKALSVVTAPMTMDADSPRDDVEGTLREAPIATGMYDMKEKYSEFINKKTMKTGPLTAGEVNDFAKWSLWNTYTEKEFLTTATKWNLLPKGRYTVQLQDQEGIPVADAKVKLLWTGKTIFEARSDNTGKAELWATLKKDAELAAGKLSIEVEKNGKKEKIDRVTNFENGINHLTLKLDCNQSQIVDIAFVFDATGSMGDELRFLQNEIKQIIFDSKKVDDRLNFRFANVFFRDKGDAYVTKQMPFTRILTEANSYIDEQSAGGGGDTPEAVEDALDDALNNLEWSDDARARLLFLILDAPPHNTPEIQEKMEKLMRLAAQKGVRIIPIGASGMQKDTEFLMRILALGTNGTYTFLTNHSGVGGHHIEPTTDKYDVETLNDLMVRLIKSYTFMPDCQSQIQDPELPYPDSVVQYPFINTHQDTLTDSVVVDSARFNPNDNNDTLNITWSYYPNPTRGIVNIVVDRDLDMLYITDIMGKELMVVKEIYKDRVVQIDLSPYPTGMYLIRYPVGKKWISGKVVLVRN
jgi:von Willebrand factor type A domain/Secretion system C-terminal sorting domain